MKLKLTLLALCLCLFNCKEAKETPKKVEFNYKYPSVQKLIDCENIDTSLLQEALYSFESDLENFYTPDKPILSRAYSIFTAQAVSNKVDYKKMVSPHSKKVLEALKQDKDLWINNPDGSPVNFNHPLFKCVAEKIGDEPLQKTFSALIETNSMSMRMIGNELRPKTFRMKDDKYLAIFMALELYYGRLYNLDLSADTSTATDETSGTTEDDAHAGHNHQ